VGIAMMDEPRRLPKTDEQPAPSVNRIERCHRLRAALKGQASQRLPEADRVTVAEALYGLLQRVERERHIPKAKVLREAGFGSDGDSTKHLSQYAIRPDASRKRLRKTVGPYEKIAKVAANLANMDENEVLLEIFGQASFWQSVGTRQAGAEFEELAAHLTYVMEGIARGLGLAEFFQAVENGGGVLTPRADSWIREQETGQLLRPEEIAVEFDFDPAWGSQLWPIEFYQPTEEAEDGNGDHIPVYPSLILGAWPVDNPFPINVTAEVTETDGSVHVVSGVVEGKNEIELRLCIVPVGRALAATPALRVQLNSALSPLISGADASPNRSGICLADSGSPHDGVLLTFPWVSMPMLRRGKSRVAGRSVANHQDIVCDIIVKDDVVPRFVKDYFVDLAAKPGSAGGVRFLPITGAVCEDWFGFALSKNHYDPMRQRVADRSLGYPIACLSFTLDSPSAKFRSDTLADIIHRCLCDPSDGLDIRLKDRAELLRGVYADALGLGVRQRQEGWERVKKRWAPPSSSAPNN
jgi:hypothetical protein